MLRHVEQVRLVVLRTAVPFHREQPVHRIDFLFRRTVRPAIRRTVFRFGGRSQTVFLIVLLVVREEIGAGTILNGFVQDIETEQGTRSGFVSVLTVGIECFAFCYRPAVPCFVSRSRVESDRSGVHIRYRVVALARGFEHKHLAVGHA